ncbi:uncharacterized protein [Eurosta solidaginis]|uniref:uncharacterized protein n=1 Tax=Eurosta solidaginis TaxID=178769 RepID=UPI00353100DD
MRYGYLLLYLALGAGLTISSAEKGTIIIARSAGKAALNPTPKPTATPLLTSTPSPLLDGAKPTPPPTKAPTKAAVVIINAPPMAATVVANAEKPAKIEITADKVTEALPQQTPSTDEPLSATQMESAPKQFTPLQVTGFITKNGQIYEVTDKNGVGMIESRQNHDSEGKSEHVCNYGSVVIYSDAPCDKVTNVRIGEVQHQVVNAALPAQNQLAAALQSSNIGQQANREDNNDFPDFDDGLPQKRKKKRVNKNPNKQRRRNDIRNRPNAVRHGNNGKRRRLQAQRLQPQQQRRRQQNNRNKSQRKQRKRLQQQKQMKRRRNQNVNRTGQRRKYQGGESFNRRRYNANDIYDEERRL